MDLKTKIAKSKSRLIFKHPFYGSLALDLQFVKTNNVPTMATDGSHIYYNVEYADNLTEQEISGVIAHEVLHVALKHCLRTKDNKDKWNYACDIVVNNMLRDEQFALPEGAIYGEDKYHDWNAERIYADLEDSDFETPTWGLVMLPDTDLSESELKQAETEIDIKTLMAHNMAKAQGKEPGSKVSELIDTIKKPKIHWKDKLYRTIGGDNPEDYTYRKPNRKVFYTQGIYMPSIENYGVGDIVIGIDTSGSVMTEELESFLTELNFISESLRPNSITVIQCDAEVQDVKTYQSNEIIDKIECYGRGGTAFSPVFDYIDNNNLNVDNFIYLTDLESNDFPAYKPDYPVLWVTTAETQAPFGEVIQLDIGQT